MVHSKAESVSFHWMTTYLTKKWDVKDILNHFVSMRQFILIGYVEWHGDQSGAFEIFSAMPSARTALCLYFVCGAQSIKNNIGKVFWRETLLRYSNVIQMLWASQTKCHSPPLYWSWGIQWISAAGTSKSGHIKSKLSAWLDMIRSKLGNVAFMEHL